MSLFFRVFQHLLPDALAWRILQRSHVWEIGDDIEVGDDLMIGGSVGGKKLERFFEGLAEKPAEIRTFADLVFLDIFPDTTREIAEWEKQFGLEPNADEETARANLAAEWAATGGQSPSYIQGVLQTAGFDVFIHEWWIPPNVSPRTARDPRDYTDIPQVGDTQCGQTSSQCGRLGAQCGGFLVNDPRYLVNSNLMPLPPPPIPSDPDTWRYFIYVGGETFGTDAEIPETRRREFERLILKLRPLQNWIVTLITYTPEDS